MKNATITYISCLMFWLGSGFIQPMLHAQTGIEIEDQTVIKNFEATLGEATLVDVSPLVQKIVPIKKRYTYQISIVPIELNYPEPVIKPLAMTEVNEFKHFDQYVKLGYGSISNPLLDMRLSFYDGDRYTIKVNGYYYSLDNTTKNEFQRMEDYKFNLHGYVRLGENSKVYAGLDLTDKERYFYADTLLLKYAQFGQNRSLRKLSTHMGLANISETLSGVNYDVKIGLDKYFKTDDFVAVPQRLSFDGRVEKRASDHINLVFPVKGKYHLEVPGQDAFFGTSYFVSFSPTINFQKGLFMAKVGADVTSTTDEGAFVWPEAELAYGLAGHYLQIFAGTRLNQTFNDFFHMLEINPWIDLGSFAVRTSLSKEYSGGIRGELNFLSYQGEVGYAQATYNPLVVNNLDSITGDQRMGVVYDDADWIFIRGNVDFALTDEITVGGTLTKNFYSVHNQEAYFGYPSLDVSAYFKMALFDNKLQIGSNLLIKDQARTRITNALGNAETRTLNSQVEMDAQIAFWPVKNFGIYGYGHNLLDNRYQRWLGYETVGLNFGGGILLKF